MIMQPEFQQSVLFFSESASDSVHDQSAGHSSCMQRRARIVQNCKFMAVFAGYASHAVFVLSVIMVGMLISRRRDSTGAVLGLGVIAPVVIQRQVPCDIFPAVLGDSGRCLLFRSSPTWWFWRHVPRSGCADRGDSRVAVLGGVALFHHAWLDSGYMLFVSLRQLGSFEHIFYVIANSVPEVTSCPAPARMEKCARMMLQLLVVFTRISGHYFHGPVVSCSHLAHCLRIGVKSLFPVSDTGGVPESPTPW